MFAQQLINGLSLGAIYALIAVGYTMVYGVLRLINFAHGDILMVGAMAGLYLFPASILGIFTPPWGGMFWVVAAVALLVNLAVSLWWLRRGGGKMYVSFSALAAGLALLLFLALRHAAAAPNQASWLNFAWAMACSMVVCGALGYIIELVAYRPMRNQPRINALITTIGVSLLLEYGGQLVFGATPQAFPQLIPGLEHNPALARIGGVIIPKVDTLIICLTLVMMFALRYLVMRTRTGMALRAVSFRFDTAALMGIDVNRIVSFTFVIGSMLAAVAGILQAIRSPAIDPLMGLLIGIKAFIAAVLGGIGNIPGAVAGGFLLGLTETLVSGYVPHGSQYRDGVAFVILIAVLLAKPSGLFGSNAVEKV